MHSDWTLHHRPHRKTDLAAPASHSHQLWQTCMRQILFSGPHEPVYSWLPGDEIYRGAEAYQFLLEVITGLRSALVGETEILGQFKLFIDQWDRASKANQSSQTELNHELVNQLLVDAKKIRSKALSHLGSQSYGSLSRKWLGSASEIHLIGYGQLAQEILPWIVKTTAQVNIYSRHPEQAKQALHAWRERVNFRQFPDETPKQGGLIVCAPVRANDLEGWLKDGQLRVLDLRGESESDPIQSPGAYLSLKQAVEKMDANKKLVAKKVELAKSLIEQSVTEWQQGQKVRPFGWDDLCA